MKPATTTIPLLVMESDGTIYVVHIPRLDEFGYMFLLEMLERYKPAIVSNKSEEVEDDGELSRD